MKLRQRVFSKLTRMGLTDCLPDLLFLKIKGYIFLEKNLNIKKPSSFNEKMQWLKLNDRNPEYTKMVDKFSVREYVKEKIGEEYLIPFLGVWDRVEDIDFNSLPRQFVLKCNHNSGGMVICRNKDNLDVENAKKGLKKSLKFNFYKVAREWPYKNVVPKIIAEEYMQDGEKEFLPVYKFFCFNGEPKIIQTIQNDKQPNETIDYFDAEWNFLDMRQNYPNSTEKLSKPEKLNEMLEIASKLSKGIPFVRVDLYSINGRIYFSEFTFYSDAGFAAFEPEEWDNILGEWIQFS